LSQIDPVKNLSRTVLLRRTERVALLIYPRAIEELHRIAWALGDLYDVAESRHDENWKKDINELILLVNEICKGLEEQRKKIDVLGRRLESW
jgi:hypothetical protein